MTRATRPRSNYRISRRAAAAHRAHGATPHLGCVLCYIGAIRTR